MSNTYGTVTTPPLYLYSRNIPAGYCQCGCGEQTELAPWNEKRRGVRKGEPRKYVKGHQVRRGSGPILVIGDIAYITLRTRGESPVHAIVDVDDVDRCAEIGWYPQRIKRGATGFYARGNVGDAEMGLHQFVFGNPPEGLQIDHINRDGLDNRKENLRFATLSQNGMNQAKRNSETTSKYRGVYRFRDRWIAAISANNSRTYLGSFAYEIEAAHAYDDAARALHGEFACVNFPDARAKAIETWREAGFLPVLERAGLEVK